MFSKAKIIWFILVFIIIIGVLILLIVLAKPLKKYIAPEPSKKIEDSIALK